MKNDMAFLLNIVLNLYEHQSTFNPNMPTRALLYFAKMYEKFIAKHEINIYSSTPKKLPFPQHIVFYNGTRDEPDRQILKLSDLFEKPPSDLTPCLECTSLMLNINYGHNRLSGKILPQGFLWNRPYPNQWMNVFRRIF